MRFLILSTAIATLVAISTANAGTSCTTRKSGSTVITSCSDSGHYPNRRTCRSYKSGSVTKTYCS